MTEITANLPVGIEPTLVADQPVTVEHAVDDFMEALWEAVAIVLGVSLVSLGLRAGAVVALVDPARARRGVRGDGVLRDRPSANLAGRPHHRARPAGRRRHDHGRDDGHAAGARRRQGTRRHLRLHLDRLSDAHRHAGHGRGVRADRLRAQRRGRIHLLDLRRRRHRADRILGRRGPVCAPARRLGPQEAQGGALGASPARSCAPSAASSCWRCGRAGSRSSSRSACSERRSTACASSRSSSSRHPTGPSCWSTCSCPRTLRSTRPRTSRPGWTSS